MLKVTDVLIRNLSDQAKRSPRKRQNYNLHKSRGEMIQRMLNAFEPKTYARPHKHENPDKLEAFVIVRGKLLAVEYDDDGNVIDHAVLDALGPCRAVEFPPRVWHSFICLEPDSVVYELKEGPYDPVTDKTFAPWAPPEEHKDAQKFNQKILKLLELI